MVPTDEDFVPLDVAMAEVLSSSRCYSSPVLQSLMPSFSSSTSVSCLIGCHCVLIAPDEYSWRGIWRENYGFLLNRIANYPNHQV